MDIMSGAPPLATIILPSEEINPDILNPSQWIGGVGPPIGVATYVLGSAVMVILPSSVIV